MSYKHLPTLLRERIEEFKIPRGALSAQFTFDRCAVWQIADDAGDTYKDSVIVKAQSAKARDLATAPRGVLVSAGARAMDELVTNGISVGHIVWFVRMSPWRREVDVVDGKVSTLMILRSSDIIASEDLMLAAKHEGSPAYLWSNGEHRYAGTKDDTRYDPTASEDY